MKKSNGPRNAGRLSVVAVLAVGCIAGNAVAQQQMRRIPEAAPAPPPPPPNAVVRVAPAPPPAAPAATAKAISTAAQVVPAAPVPIPRPGGSASRGKMVNKAPTMNKGGLAPNRAYVPFPQNMTHTVDPKTCTQHGGFAAGLGCTAGLPNGMLALVWDCANCKVDGYRLYRVDGTRHDAVAIPANGASFTAALLDAPQGGFGGRCYAVTAYRGTYESELSDHFCADGGSVVSTVTLQADQVRTSLAYMTGKSSDIAYASQGDLEVGGMHMTDKSALGDIWLNWISRGGLHFDLGQLAQKHVFSARLHVTVDTTNLDSGGVDHGTSCTSLIALGQDYWWKHTDWILASGQRNGFNGFDTPARLKPGSMDGPDSTYDVTPIVSDWVQGAQQNFGFVLMTDDTGINGFSENACYTTYTPSYSLEVKFSG